MLLWREVVTVVPLVNAVRANMIDESAVVLLHTNPGADINAFAVLADVIVAVLLDAAVKVIVPRLTAPDKTPDAKVTTDALNTWLFVPVPLHSIVIVVELVNSPRWQPSDGLVVAVVV